MPSTAEAGVPADRTLVEILADLRAEGFEGDVEVTDEGQLCCEGCGRCRAPEDTELLTLRRVEGASDPADMAAVLGVRCPECGRRAVAVLRFGPEAGPGEAAVLRLVEDRRADRARPS